MTTLEHPDGFVKIERSDGHLKKVVVYPDKDIFVPIKSCETTYPISLIALILKRKGVDYLCDEICRDIDPAYVQRDLEFDLRGYFDDDEFENIRILDFGCGSGASSLILSRMFPQSEIVGVELSEKHIEIANARLKHYKYRNIEFLLSPSGTEFPVELGNFDLVIMSAVYEHLLPAERIAVTPLVWEVLKPGGLWFLNMTPNRWFPVEHHTTGLPFLNYIPQSLALAYARRFTNRIDKNESWEELLRRGIRGASENEITRLIEKTTGEKPILLEPNQRGNKDRIDLWYSQLNQKRHVFAKKAIKYSLKTIRAITRMTLLPNLSLVMKKPNSN